MSDPHAYRCVDDDAHGRASATERRTWWTVALTLTTMAVELVVGAWSGSLALTADGWHMATHAGALALSALAWSYARSRRGEFSFGSAKVHALAGFTNALALLAVAAQMVVEAAHRLLHPSPIRYREALVVAAVGLLVNLVSAWLLMPSGHDHSHSHGHSHDHSHSHDPSHKHGHDAHGAHNLRGAYLHVLADALTSVFAIAALVLGQRLRWTALDPLSAVVGSVLISRWGVALVRDTSRVLLDRVPSTTALARVREVLERDGAQVLDLHLWEPVAGRWYCTVTLRASAALRVEDVREALTGLGPMHHVTIELRVA